MHGSLVTLHNYPLYFKLNSGLIRIPYHSAIPGISDPFDNVRPGDRKKSL
jgi:hypothetical protein